MTARVQPPSLLIPESAPFTAEQRSWLSGYFSALLSTDAGGATPISGSEAWGGGAPAGPGRAAHPPPHWARGG